MATDPRAALDDFVAALQAHLEAALAAQDPDDDGVLDAAAAVADAFDTYDEVLFDATGVDTPLDLLDDEDEDDEDDEDGLDVSEDELDLPEPDDED